MAVPFYIPNTFLQMSLQNDCKMQQLPVDKQPVVQLFDVRKLEVSIYDIVASSGSREANDVF